MIALYLLLLVIWAMGFVVGAATGIIAYERRRWGERPAPRWLLRLVGLLCLLACTSTPPSRCAELEQRYPPKAGGWCDCECQRGDCREGFVCWQTLPDDAGNLTVGCDWYRTDAGGPRCSP